MAKNSGGVCEVGVEGSDSVGVFLLVEIPRESLTGKAAIAEAFIRLVLEVKRRFRGKAEAFQFVPFGLKTIKGETLTVSWLAVAMKR